MPKRVALPRDLVGRPFSIAEGRSAGLGEGRLRGKDLERPFHGVRAGAGTVDSTIARCRAYLPNLRAGQAFSHLSAAMLWGCPLPAEFQNELALHVVAQAPARAPAGRGVMGHQSGRHIVVTRHGLPVVDPGTMFCQVAPFLSLDDLVSVGDHVVLDPYQLDPYDMRPYFALARLQQTVESYTGRGARAAASASSLVRQGAESRRETLLRLLLMRAGLPEPELNVEVRDDAGRWLGRGDLVFRRWRTIAEYDGDGHRTDARQYEKDIARIDRFIAAGWRPVRVRKSGLSSRPLETIARVEEALAAGGWRR